MALSAEITTREYGSSREETPVSHNLVNVSNSFFILASLFFLIGAIANMKSTGATSSWIMSCLGALGFIIVGSIDLYNKAGCYHVVLVFAGIFGLAAELTDQSHQGVSLYFNLFATLLYFTEAINLIRHHCKRPDVPWLKTLLIADFHFLLGSIIDVTLALVYLRFQNFTLSDSRLETRDEEAELVSCISWVVSALLTTFVFCKLGEKGLNAEETETVLPKSDLV